MTHGDLMKLVPGDLMLSADHRFLVLRVRRLEEDYEISVIELQGGNNRKRHTVNTSLHRRGFSWYDCVRHAWWNVPKSNWARVGR